MGTKIGIYMILGPEDQLDQMNVKNDDFSSLIKVETSCPLHVQACRGVEI